MNNTIPRITLALLLAFGGNFAFAAQGTGNAMRSEEQRQMSEDASAKAQYNRAVKEARAAYADAVKDCGKMRGGEKTSCMKEAKENLNNDMTYAKSQASDGASGTRPMRRSGTSR